jgi:transposase-like protein
MRRDSSLSEQQRIAVLALFEEGRGSKAVASYLRVSRRAVEHLHGLWQVRGGDALVARSTKQTFTFETKYEVVQRFLGGETRIALAQEFGIASPKTVQVWARIYAREGEDGLRPKPKGRPHKDPDAPPREETELERLQRENEYLRTEVAYLKKLKALIAQERR